MKKYRNHFRSLETFKTTVRKIKREEWADWIKIGKHWYVNEEFDEEGKNMRFSSITEGLHIDINTSDRYKDIWLKDAEIEQYKADFYRFNPSYYINQEEFKKLSKIEKSELLKLIADQWGIRVLVEFMEEYLF